MKPVAGDWLSDLKLRGTRGQIGNQGIDPYKFVPTMSQVEKKDVAWLVNGAKPLTLNARDWSVIVFTWETVETLDFGFDITALNGRLQSTFDWYRRDTKDMLAPVGVAVSGRCFRTFAEYPPPTCVRKAGNCH